jgi:hypothetical protein
MARDDDDELSWWDELRSPLTGVEETPPAPPPGESFSALDLVQSMFQRPLLGESVPPPAPPTLRSAATNLFRASGLSGNPLFEPGADSEPQPPSWKLPSRHTPGLATILGDDTAVGPGIASSAVPTSPDLGAAPGTIAPSASPRSSAAPGASSPLDHPDAQTGLALTAADSLIRRGAELIAGVAGGNRTIVEQVVNAAVQWMGGLLPADYKASAAKTGEVALAAVTQRLDDDATALRRRGTIGALAHRRTEVEHEHTHAILTGDPAKIAEARRDMIEAWSAERRARGDGEAEINAGARALERDYRKAALRHRLAQLDEGGIKRAVDEDKDAKSDPTLAREVAGDILRLRREDPARVAEASVERKLAQKKRDGQIDTPEEETRERYKLRLEAQAQRGIPEHERRILTNAERTALATEYLRIESSQRKAAADAWLNREAQNAGPHAERFKAELSGPPGSNAPPASVAAPADRQPNQEERVEPAQASPDTAKPPALSNSPSPPDERAPARDSLRNKVDADANTLDRDYDPDQKPGQPSRIKRAFALLKYVDDPAFDDLARELDYDPARLRAIARLLTAQPGDYDQIMEGLYQGLSDDDGRIKDMAF